MGMNGSRLKLISRLTYEQNEDLSCVKRGLLANIHTYSIRFKLVSSYSQRFTNDSTKLNIVLPASTIENRGNGDEWLEINDSQSSGLMSNPCF
eukprot:scaffold208841_cov19-Prasinocladus_malaysianus.AAC.1